MATNKQKAAFDKILENPAKPVSEVMLEVGYDPNTAKSPQDLTTSKGFLQLLEENGLDDLSLAQKHKELLHSDHNIAVKALDMAYKVKAHYAPERSVALNVTGTVKDLSKYQSIKDKFEQELYGQYTTEPTNQDESPSDPEQRPAQDNS